MAQQSPISLERMIIESKTKSALSADARGRASHRFYRIADHFEEYEVAAAKVDGSSAKLDIGKTESGIGGNNGDNHGDDNPGDNDKSNLVDNGRDIGGTGSNGSSRRYNQSRLIRLTYDHACSPLSQDNFLRAFFSSLDLSMDGDEALDERTRSKFFGFGHFLFNNFFLPLKASARKTPQPSPASHSAIQRLREGGQFAGTMERISALRGACLIRDRHRCVVSQTFDCEEGIRRYKSAGKDARDDDGDPFDMEKLGTFAPSRVAHIIPHCLTRLEDLSPSKQATLAILNMLDHGVQHLIEGTDIDQPRNALTLNANTCHLFSNFNIHFEPAPDISEPHTYRLETFLWPILVRPLVAGTLISLANDGTIEPPLPRLLADHRAVARILHLSGAGSYIDEILADMENTGYWGAEPDGSTDLGRLVHLGLWRGGAGAW